MPVSAVVSGISPEMLVGACDHSSIKFVITQHLSTVLLLRSQRLLLIRNGIKMTNDYDAIASYLSITHLDMLHLVFGSTFRFMPSA